MKTVLSVDVAKNKSMIMLMNSDGEIFIDTKEINHNLEDFEKVKEEYGEYVALMGNIPCCSILMEGTEQKVYDYALQECLDGGYDGRFILSGDCDLSPLTPDENIVAAVRAAKDAEKILF